MILLQNVGKYYYSETSVTQALRKINLEFHTGEFVAITGESGSGKSTLLNIISGMDTFDDGELYFNGEPTFQYDAADWEDFRREQIGFVFQDYNLIGHYSALDNVTSALLIMGIQQDTAIKRGMDYLEKVGLKGMENQRASELSSGQKQRLSIARALAKETKIIVADEPTGNLDSETGDQIIALLKKLSKDRLILMVTHNYEQAEPYVTRKIRLHDGEVVVDVQVNTSTDTTDEGKIVDISTKLKENGEAAGQEGQTVSVPKNGQQNSSESEMEMTKNSKLWKKHQRTIAWNFARMNTRTQKGRSMLFRIFFLFTALISFVLIGQLYKCADDTYTKDYDKSIFSQKNDRRLSVKRKDNKELTDKDIKKMQSIKNVVQVDSQDYAGDINYYMEEGKDYVYHHETKEEEEEELWNMDTSNWNANPRSMLADENTPDFKKKNKFMRSTTCIDKSDLSQGRLPEKRTEIVLYPTKNMKLGDKKKIYFSAENIWESEQYYVGNLKVVGFLKEETTQVYFYPDFCRMLSASANGDEVNLFYAYDRRYGYRGKDHFILTIGEDLQEREEEDSSGPYARVSRNHIPNTVIFDDTGNAKCYPVEDLLPGIDEIFVDVNKSKNIIPKQLLDMDGKKSKIRVLGFEDTDEKTNKNFNSHSGIFVEVSEKVFNTYYPRQSSQASVYIKNYTKTDKVLKALDKLGYEGISTYRIASIHYNEKKVMDRLTFICIALGILIVLFAVEILILRSIMKIRIRDFYVMKSMGMQLPVIRQISFYEMTRYCIEAILLTAILMIILNLLGIPYITSIMIYYGFIAFVTYVAYNIILELATVRAFNRLLTGKMLK